MDKKLYISLLLLLPLAVGMICLSWQRWPDILVDFGRELYVPWQINNGKVLYRDITHLYGPLSHYFNSLLFRIFGTHLMTLAIFNIGLIAILVCMIYHIFLQISDYIVAIAASATFLSIFAFSQYVQIGNYNFVCPYSHEVTHGILLSFLSISTFMIYLKKRQLFWLVLTAILTGLVSLTKVEIFLSLSIAIGAGLFFLIWIERLEWLSIFRISGLFGLGFFFPIICFIKYFSFYMPFKKAVSLIIIPYKVLFKSPIPSSIFYQSIFGTVSLYLNLFKLFKVTGIYILVLIIFGLMSYLVNRIKNTKLRKITIWLILCIVAISTPVIFNKVAWFDIPRPLPLVMAGWGTYLFFTLLRLRNNPQKIKHLLPLFVLTVFGAILLLKMLLNVHIFHYGFALSLPASLLLVYIILYQVPILLGRFFGNANFIRVLGLILLGIAMAWHINWTRQVYILKTYPVGSGGDTILTVKPELSNKGICMELALKRIKELIKEDETFVVFPEGVILNYLSRRKNPTAYFEFTPSIIEVVGEDEFIDFLSKGSPDYIILTDKDTSEYGYRYFGQDYGVKIFTWIKTNYLPICQIGNPPLSGEGFGIIIAKRLEAIK